MLSVKSATVILKEVKDYLEKFAAEEKDQSLVVRLTKWSNSLTLEEVQNMPSVPQSEGDLYLLRWAVLRLNIFAKVDKQTEETEVKGIILLER